MVDPSDPFDDFTPAANVGGIPGEGSFDVGTCLSRGWTATIQNLGPVLGVLVLGWLMSFVSYFTCVGAFIVIPLVMWGQLKFLLNTLDGHCEFNDLFLGFKNFGKVLPQALLLWLLFVLLGITGSLVQYAGMFLENEFLIVSGVAASFVWALAVMIRFYWAPFFMVDQGLGAVDSLRASWQATEGNWLNMILLIMLSIVVSLAGLLALVVGLLIAAPVIYFMFGAAYRQSVGTPAPAPTADDLWE